MSASLRHIQTPILSLTLHNQEKPLRNVCDASQCPCVMSALRARAIFDASLHLRPATSQGVKLGDAPPAGPRLHPIWQRFRGATEHMPKRSRAALFLVAVAGVCFLAGVVSTLLWASLSTSSPSQQQPSVIFTKTSDAFNTAEALTTSQELLSDHKTHQASSLSRTDLLIAIPSSLAR